MTLPEVADVNAWIEVSEHGATLVLKIGGELDSATRGLIEPAIDAAIFSAASIIFDVGALTFCDSSGLAMFVKAHENATARGTVLAMRHQRPNVRRVFEITGIDALFPVAT